MGRIKDDLIDCAEQIANEMHGCSFHELDEDTQDEVWHQAEEMLVDEYATDLDHLKEMIKYGDI